jgi:hypothetical protein
MMKFALTPASLMSQRAAYWIGLLYSRLMKLKPMTQARKVVLAFEMNSTILKFIVLTTFALSAGLIHFSASADELGQLFTSPKERAVLNTLREHYDPKRQDHIEVQQSKIPVEAPSQIELNGVVERSDGKNAVWVNGKSTINTKQKGIHINSQNMSANKVRVRLTNPKRTVSMKPGEVYNPESGRVQDIYKVQENKPAKETTCISTRPAANNIALRCE